MGCEPRFAAEQNEPPSGIVLRPMRFDRLSLFNRQAADDFRNTATLTGFGQINRPLNR